MLGYGIDKKIQKKQCGAETIFFLFCFADADLSDGERLKYGLVK